MPHLGPVRRDELVRFLRLVGFEGPISGGNHQFMIRGDLRLHIPNPHTYEIGRDLLVRILKQAGIDRQTWEDLR